MASETSFDYHHKKYSHRKRSRNDKEQENSLDFSSDDNSSSTDSDLLTPGIKLPKQRRVNITKPILKQCKIVKAINELQMRIERINLNDKDTEIVKVKEIKNISAEDKVNLVDKNVTTPKKRTRVPVRTNAVENEYLSKEEHGGKLIKLSNELPATRYRVTFIEPNPSPTKISRSNKDLFNNDINPKDVTKDKNAFGYRKMGRTRRVTESSIENEYKSIKDKNLSLIELATRTAPSALK